MKTDTCEHGQRDGVYDFSIYGTASALIFADLFFQVKQGRRTIGDLRAYAAGFIACPFGGLFFGWLGDKLGRKVVLVATVLLMGGSTFCIGWLLTYGMGGWSAVLLVTLRLLQGFGAGAEQAGASLIVSEFAPPSRRGFYTALPFAAVSSGICSPARCLRSCSVCRSMTSSYGWRIPFLFRGPCSQAFSSSALDAVCVLGPRPPGGYLGCFKTHQAVHASRRPGLFSML